MTFLMSSDLLSNIYYFNPTCEYAIANGNASWQPNKLLTTMEEDLSTLPLFFANPHDIVLVKKIPDHDYLASLRSIGIDPPHFAQLRNITANPGITGKPFGWLLPWGWSPVAHRVLASLKPHCSAEFLNSPVSEWKEESREIYSKRFAILLQQKIISRLDPAIMPPPDMTPQICSQTGEIDFLIKKWGKIMVKSPWSTSGRGIQPVTKIPVVPKVWEKITGMINQQGYVIVEPLLNKQLDLALQFEIKNKKITFLGISRFFTDKKGQYGGNFLNGWNNNSDEEIINFAGTIPSLLINPIIEEIKESNLLKLYEGNFGVDTLIFRSDDSKIRINTFLEINLRQNMGLLSIHLEKLIDFEKTGTFKIFYDPGTTFYNFKKKMEARHPVQIHNNKIKYGFFPLTPARETTKFGAYISVI